MFTLLTAELFRTPRGDDLLVKGSEAFLFLYFIFKKEKMVASVLGITSSTPVVS